MATRATFKGFDGRTYYINTYEAHRQLVEAAIWVSKAYDLKAGHDCTISERNKAIKQHVATLRAALAANLAELEKLTQP
jgi:hypothetical protein